MQHKFYIKPLKFSIPSLNYLIFEKITLNIKYSSSSKITKICTQNLSREVKENSLKEQKIYFV